jgi:hypothetical protein
VLVPRALLRSLSPLRYAYPIMSEKYIWRVKHKLRCSAERFTASGTQQARGCGSRRRRKQGPQKGRRVAQFPASCEHPAHVDDHVQAREWGLPGLCAVTYRICRASRPKAKVNSKSNYNYEIMMGSPACFPGTPPAGPTFCASPSD